MFTLIMTLCALSTTPEPEPCRDVPVIAGIRRESACLLDQAAALEWMEEGIKRTRPRWTYGKLRCTDTPT